jgi:hypothetical protein
MAGWVLEWANKGFIELRPINGLLMWLCPAEVKVIALVASKI